MAKASPIQNDFSAGEFGPLMQARSEIDRYKRGLNLCQNYVPTPEGPLTRRPGTKYINEVKDSSDETRIIPFKFSVTDTYVMEFGDLYVRFYREYGILGGGTPVEVVTPYSSSQIWDIRVKQSGDTVYIVHPDVSPRKLVRLAENSFELQTFIGTSFIGQTIGPFEPMQDWDGTNSYWNSIIMDKTNFPGQSWFLAPTITTAVTITNNGGICRMTLSKGITYNGITRGIPDGYTVTVSSVTGTTGANGTWVVDKISDTVYDLLGSTYNAAQTGALGSYRVHMFLPHSAGEYIRYRPDTGTTYYTTYFIDTNTFGYRARVDTINLGAALSLDTCNRYQMHLWGTTYGYPSVLEFHEDRLWFGGVASFPQRLDGSVPGDYQNFTPAESDGTVTAGNAISVTLLSQDLNKLHWLESDDKGLICGLEGGEQVVKPASSLEALSAVNVTAKRAPTYGAAEGEAVRVGQGVIYAQRGSRGLNELKFAYQTENFSGTNLSRLAKHLTVSGIKQIVYTQEPVSSFWAITEDGKLLGMCYDREDDNLIAGWHKHFIGGVVDTAGNPATVESICVVPAADGRSDELWMIVKRRINGATQRYVEYMTPYFDEDFEKEDAWFLDSGLALNNPLTISNITEVGSTVRVTSTSHGLSNGNEVRLTEIEGAIELNGNVYEIENVAANTFDLKNVTASEVSAYVSGGFARKMVTAITGLSHLEGQTVQVFADGAKYPDATVSAGAITLDVPAARVLVGLHSSAKAQLLRFDAGSEDGTAIGKLRRTDQCGFLLYRTAGLKTGTDFDNLFEIQETYRTTESQNNDGPELFSGITVEPLQADSDYNNMICLEQDAPFPGTILAVMPGMVTQDGG